MAGIEGLVRAMWFDEQVYQLGEKHCKFMGGNVSRLWVKTRRGSIWMLGVMNQHEELFCCCTGRLHALHIRVRFEVLKILLTKDHSSN